MSPEGSNGHDVAHHDIGAVHIDGNVFYNLVRTTQITVVRVETQLNGLIASQQQEREADRAARTKIDERLAAMERRVWAIPSAAGVAVVISLVGLVLAVAKQGG